MTLHFAYGSNMARAPMARRCPDAQALGVATLADWRFVITVDGYASVMPCAGRTVHGVLWRLTPRDLAALNAYESLDSGLYGRSWLSIRRNGKAERAMVYLGRARRVGRPRPGYLAGVVAAARDWRLPDCYIAELARWARAGDRPASAVDIGELA
jgi:gamma-glutamylcyclotransferase (GGCT)/AIG2-like uncharacterized protein YtfP